MEIDKARLVELLRRRSLEERAAWVDRQLPTRIDVDLNAGLLAMLCVDPADLAADTPPGA